MPSDFTRAERATSTIEETGTIAGPLLYNDSATVNPQTQKDANTALFDTSMQ